MGGQLGRLITEARGCRLCEAQLPLGARPVFLARPDARVVLVGQAPGARVHASGVPWDDPSGDTLRDWLGMSRDRFYNDPGLAILPTGFCYPGKGPSGDAAPRPECAPTWHPRFLQAMPKVSLIVTLGRYAQDRYVHAPSATLSDTVRRWPEHLDQGVFPLPHPSPRNRIWIRRRPWFEAEVLPALRGRIQALLGGANRSVLP
ncbi:uracil-DNA glycosylase family protein [uncultured Abyssibacter sp.]|uniref:uracil-DNA glycosylase family protein n=1 Tax=uncultured Abyssibacter sp. TaxID=2320202 RepID=UPI0032B26FB4